ncbi:periplasmic chaperone for outer membrane proteins SurA [Mesocricetibacter intestinalis]|uniref:Periplasmic chaperone for outer membrane proteins SurA n=1 Tax=Mesocricetibacter intestinalis TaxID=1521930 RepID=A0A4R6VHW0_9PAST|nr:peptidylprolyl isomerase [Mesocricetibacter intestinalis]TDQ57954.1 periplasmic chaperone for outer membrane proteins SurA [Mesocricetibacter intestinalis]
MKLANLKSLFFLMLGTMVFSGGAQALEQVVATVDGIPVLESQLQRALGKRANTEANRAKALDKIIDDILVQKAVSESGVVVDASQIDLAMENIAAQNGLTYGQLLDALDYQGMSLSQFRANLANQILMAEVRNRSIGKNIDVTREQVESLSRDMLQQAKNSGKKAQITGTQYRVRHILLKLNPLLNDAQAKAKLAQVRSDILAGKTSFEQAAKDYSKDYLSGANGGDLGFAFPENYVGAFAHSIKTTKQGAISAPFKTEYGWHILQVTDQRQGDKTEDAYRQKAYETLVNRQLQEESRDWVKALRKGAEIKYLTK